MGGATRREEGNNGSEFFYSSLLKIPDGGVMMAERFQWRKGSGGGKKGEQFCAVGRLWLLIPTKESAGLELKD